MGVAEVDLQIFQAGVALQKTYLRVSQDVGSLLHELMLQKTDHRIEGIILRPANLAPTSLLLNIHGPFLGE